MFVQNLSFKLDSFVSYLYKCIVFMQPVLELKTQPMFHPVTWSLYTTNARLITFRRHTVKLNLLFKLYFHWRCFKAKMPTTVAHDIYHCTCLGHLGWYDTNRNDPICVTLPKVAKASTVTWLLRVTVASGS